jgi:hypothetical protein
MPRWVLRCPKCHSEFTYKDIETPIIQLALRDPFGIVPKPTVANAGETRQCPSCHVESRFHRHELFYRQDA